MTVDIEKLKALALAATKGPWIHDAEDNIIYPAHGGRMIDVCCRSTDLGTTQRDNNAAFVAAANPATVLELIADRDALMAQRDEARAEVERLRARFEYIEGNATTHGGGNGFMVSFFVPEDSEDIGCGIDAAIAASKERA